MAGIFTLVILDQDLLILVTLIRNVPECLIGDNELIDSIDQQQHVYTGRERV